MSLSGPGPTRVDLPVRWRTREARRAIEVIGTRGFEIITPRHLLALGGQGRPSVDTAQAGAGVLNATAAPRSARLANHLRHAVHWNAEAELARGAIDAVSLSHRHHALCVTSERGALAAARLVTALARVSPRGHLVLVTADVPTRSTQWGPAGEQTTSGDDAARLPRVDQDGVSHDDQVRLAEMIAAGQLERAEAWCVALILAADLCRDLVPEPVVVQAVRLCLQQSRCEEAGRLAARAGAACERRRLWRWVASVCAGGGLAVRGERPAAFDGRRIPPDGVAPRSNTRGIFARRAWSAGRIARPGATQDFHHGLPTRQTRAGPPPGSSVLVDGRGPRAGRPLSDVSSHTTLSHGASMFLFPAVPALLQSLVEADDELVALRAAARWALRHAAASGVAFIGGADAVVLASAGQPLGAAERLPAMAVCDAACAERGPLVACTAAVRYAGAHVGAVVVSGPGERRGTCFEAATMLAAVCAPAVRTRLDALAAHRQGRERLADIIGDSPATAALRDEVARAAVTPFAVLVEGESGTGKELVARALHRLSARRDRRCVAVNCAALSDDLIEAELFGHSRGAFTGAVGPRTGLFEDAHGGTLFLDEVAELSPRAQAKLLRVLQEREVRRVGENATRPVDVRVVAATNRPLADAVAGGQFRHDLMFRLAVVRIRLVPLRDRAEDIAPIARACWLRTMRDLDKRAVLGADALARLATHTWPGNVRELQNVMAGLGVVAPTRGRVSARHVDLVLASAGAGARVPPMSLEHARRLCDRQTVTAALARHAGRRSRAARELGLTRQGLTKLLRRLHIPEIPIEGVA